MMGLQPRVGRYGLAGLALAMGLSAPAAAMTTDEFLTRVDALSAKGMMAMFSRKEIAALTDEGKCAGDAYRADLEQARGRGDTSLGCPPPRGQAKINSNELIAYLRTISGEARKTMPFKTALYGFMKTRFPCS